MTVFHLKQASWLEEEQRIINSPLKHEWREKDLNDLKNSADSKGENLAGQKECFLNWTQKERLQGWRYGARLSRERRDISWGVEGEVKRESWGAGGSYFTRSALLVPKAAALPPCRLFQLTWTSQLIVCCLLTEWDRVVLTPLWIQLTTKACHFRVVVKLDSVKPMVEIKCLIKG